MATQNSIDSYAELRDSGELSEKQAEVLRFIRRYPNCTYNDISRVLAWHHNTVTARIKELRDMGYIVCSGTKVDEITGKSNNTYRVRKPDEPADDTSNSAQPKIPKAIADRLREQVSSDTDFEPLIVISNGVKWQTAKVGTNIGVKYGDFISLRNIVTAREDTAQNRFIVAGNNYTVFFRLN